jgi:PAS domain S-box-containing protein
MAPNTADISWESLKLLQALDEGTASYTGDAFFEELVKNFAKLLNTKGAWITEYDRSDNRLNALAFWLDGKFIKDYNYSVRGTPCEYVIDEKRILHIPENVIQLYPNDPDLRPLNAISYMGAPLIDTGGQVLGNLAILDDKVLPEKEQTFLLFRIFSARASAELQRTRSNRVILERERRLSLLINSIMDAVIEFDQSFIIQAVNKAAEKTFKRSPDTLLMKNLSGLLSAESFKKVSDLCDKLCVLPDGNQFIWVSGGLQATCNQRDLFEAEATMSRYELDGKPFYSLILRNISDKLTAQKRIDSLQAETNYLRNEVFSSSRLDITTGKSPQFKKVLQQAAQVAYTDATVLLTGETGTGKELMAKHIHETSRRKDKPFIKLNCAGIPPSLIESELFGHVKGAFTDASEKRDGRFTLAHQGTLFLDEVGELPISLQPKLLRVLQEGEFEPVGSSVTIHSDVRIIAATNRDLPEMIRNQKFREDLYYRLNIFPIQLPPLRDRIKDLKPLVNSFLDNFCQQYNKEVQPPGQLEWEILQSYHWPGNIRELQNILERAVITSQNGTLNLLELLPDVHIPNKMYHKASTDSEYQILNEAAIKDFEKTNMIRALNKCEGRVSGNDGAAALLGIPATTFYSRMKALDSHSKKNS